MKKKLISQILSGAISVEELDDSSIGGEPNATVDDSKIPAAGTDSTADGTEPTPEEIPATDPKPEDDVDGDATQTDPAAADPAAEEPATPAATDDAGATEPGTDTGTEESPADTAAPADGDATGATEPPVDDPATAGDATAAATDGGTEDAGEPPAAEEPPVDDASVASLGDEAGASGPAAGEAGEPELDENGEPVKKEPSPDAEVTPLPEGVDPESKEEDSNIDETAIEEDEAEVEESEEDIIAKADAVADLTNAQTSLEELVAEIESTIQDGGLTPEGVIAAQGAANDILNEVGEEPIGLPSQESFGTFEGRRANTTIAVESIGEKIKAVGARGMELLRALLEKLRQFCSVQRHLLVSVVKGAEAKMKADYHLFKGGESTLVNEQVSGLFIPVHVKSISTSSITGQIRQFGDARTRLDGIMATIEQAAGTDKLDIDVIRKNPDIDTTLSSVVGRIFDKSMSSISLEAGSHLVTLTVRDANDLRALYNAAKNSAESAIDFIDTAERKSVALQRKLAVLAKKTAEGEERSAVTYVSASLGAITRIVRANATYARTLFAVAMYVEKRLSAES